MCLKVNSNQNFYVLSLEEVRKVSDLCSLVKRLKSRIISGKWGHVSQTERPYKSVAESLSVENGLIIRGSCIVAPPLLRRRIIELAHDSIHPSQENTLAHISKEFWWPGMTRDVGEYINNCPTCLQKRPVLKKTLDVWPKEEKPWCRVHMDHCMVDGAGTILILSDAYSGWPEAIVVSDRSTDTTMRVLKTVFARNGVPETLVSDNAAEFRAEKLTSWLKQIGCKPMNSPPYNPSSNGQAERFVRTLKDALKMWNRVVPFQPFLQKVLLTFRTAKPSGGRPYSPDMMMWNRRLRHPLTMSETVGTTVWMRNHADSEPKKAAFVSQHGRNTALVFVEDQGLRLAHRNQWTPRSEPEFGSESTTEVFVPPEIDRSVSASGDSVAGGDDSVSASGGDFDSAVSRQPESARANTSARGRYNLRKIPRQCYKL